MAYPKDTTTWMSVQQVADHFAMDREGIYKIIKRGGIPYVQIGRTYRIPTSWVDSQVPRFAEAEGAA